MCSVGVAFSLFFFKQKTAYEVRISVWSSDVCSSDLLVEFLFQGRSVVVFRQAVGEIADQALDVGLAQKRGRFAHRHGAGAEALDDEAEIGQRSEERR